MKKEKIWFNWHCPHCEHRNRVTFPFQFELPKYYSAEWECDECGKTSKLEFNFTVNGWPERRRPPKLRKRKKERHDRKEKIDNSTQKDRGYTNNHGKI